MFQWCSKAAARRYRNMYSSFPVRPPEVYATIMINYLLRSGYAAATCMTGRSYSGYQRVDKISIAREDIGCQGFFDLLLGQPHVSQCFFRGLECR